MSNVQDLSEKTFEEIEVEMLNAISLVEGFFSLFGCSNKVLSNEGKAKVNALYFLRSCWIFSDTKDSLLENIKENIQTLDEITFRCIQIWVSNTYDIVIQK